MVVVSHLIGTEQLPTPDLVRTTVLLQAKLLSAFILRISHRQNFRWRKELIVYKILASHTHSPLFDHIWPNYRQCSA